LQKTIFSLTPNGAAEMPTPVQRAQFTISTKGITHTPTGATYTPHPGAPHAGIMDQVTCRTDTKEPALTGGLFS
jgi:hypothetical protein